MKARAISLACLVLALMTVLPPTTASARPLGDATSYGGVYSSWPTTWSALNSLNDPHDVGLANERIDFVGDTTNPGAYVASNSTYLFFRIRVDDGAPTTFADTILILIDKSRDGSLDYAFMWDSKSMDQTKHGLELGVPWVFGPRWMDSRMDDRDGNSADKLAPPDFGLSNGDGYIRILTNQPTTNFGTTTFIDFAIKWSYLEANSTLGRNQSWAIQLGSIDQANDHNLIKDDVAGNKLPSENATFPANVAFSPTAVIVDGLHAHSHVKNLIYGVLAAALLLSAGLGAAQLWRREHAD
jgi:hypothetical protein